MSNPYESPVLHQEERNAKAIVQGPAIALIVVSSIAILLGLLALGLDIVLIAVGAIERLEAMREQFRSTRRLRSDRYGVSCLSLPHRSCCMEQFI